MASGSSPVPIRLRMGRERDGGGAGVKSPEAEDDGLRHGREASDASCACSMGARANPPRGSFKAQSQVLRDVKLFDRSWLSPTTPVVKDAVDNDDEDEDAMPQAISRSMPVAKSEHGMTKWRRKLPILRALEDDGMNMVLPGLFIGGVGGARSLASLRSHGITHVVNASPVVPCFFQGEVAYLVLDLYDSSSENAEKFFEQSNAFIQDALDKRPRPRDNDDEEDDAASAPRQLQKHAHPQQQQQQEQQQELPERNRSHQHRQQDQSNNNNNNSKMMTRTEKDCQDKKRDAVEVEQSTGGVLVHCYAGVSRSTTIVLAYLMARRGMRLAEALALVKAARPAVCPNQGFMEQLRHYERKCFPKQIQKQSKPRDDDIDLGIFDIDIAEEK